MQQKEKYLSPKSEILELRVRQGVLTTSNEANGESITWDD